MTAIVITVKDRTPELLQKLDAAIGRFVVKGAAYIEGEVKSSMAEAKTGRAYRRGKGSTHIASAPGESPAIDSSNLVGSIETIISANRLEAKIGTPVEYGHYLETGTENMEARPVWEPEAREALPTLERMLKAEIRRVR